MDPFTGLPSGARQTEPEIKVPFRQRMKNIKKDYATALKGVGTYWRQKPVALAAWGFGLSVTSLIWWTVPGQQDYESQLVHCMDELSAIPEAIRSKTSTEYVVAMEQLRAEGLLKVTNCVFFALLQRQDFSDDVRLCRSHVVGLGQPNLLRKWHDSIQDVGFCGRWMYLDHFMQDCDVND